MAADKRTPLFEEDFADDAFRDRWVLEGFADLMLGRDGDMPFLRMATTRNPENPKNKQSVLWCRQRFPHDLRVQFRAQGATANRAIFYFNAVPMPDSGHETIFDWGRPDAEMTRYAGDSRIAMYTVGMLRDDEDKCNLRYIGGTISEAYAKLKFEPYQQASIIESYASAFEGKPDTWFDFEVRVEGRRIAMDVNGQTMFDVEDRGRAGSDDWTWDPLSEPGWLAFRNFVPNEVCIAQLRVSGR